MAYEEEDTCQGESRADNSGTMVYGARGGSKETLNPEPLKFYQVLCTRALCLPNFSVTS
jgi:hypothetical protein